MSTEYPEIRITYISIDEERLTQQRYIARLENQRAIETELQADMQAAWQHTVQSDLSVASDFLHACQCAIESGMGTTTEAASVQISRSILHILMGEFSVAEQALQVCLQANPSSLAPLTFHTLQLYLSYVALQRCALDRACVHMQESLAWFHQEGIDYLPEWWHPTIMGEVLAFAIVQSIHSDAAQRILCRRGIERDNPAVAALRAYLREDDRQVRRNVYAALQQLGVEPLDMLSGMAEGRIRDALEEMLCNGPLSMEGFVHLQQKLITANKRRHVNWTVVAVFGLYVQRLDRSEIADKLGVSESTVRNSVTDIYRCFGLELKDFRGRRTRWRRLVEVARSERLVMVS